MDMHQPRRELLQLKLKCKSKRKILYWFNTRELNGVPSTKYLSYTYWVNGLYYTRLAYSKEHMLSIRLIYNKHTV